MRRHPLFLLTAALLLSPTLARAQDSGLPAALQGLATPSSSTSSTSSPSSSSSSPATPIVPPPSPSAAVTPAGLPVPSHPTSEASIPVPSPSDHIVTHHNSSASTTATDKTAADKTPDKTTAPAAPTPATAFDPHGQPYTPHYFVHHGGLYILGLERRPGFGPGQFVLHVGTQYPVNGCARLSSLPHTVDIKDGTVNISLENYTSDLRKAPDAPEYACHQGPQMPAADIMLDRDELMKHNVKSIKLVMGGATDSYDVVLNKHQIRLQYAPGRTVRRFQTEVRDGTGNLLMHWFYPKGTVILYVQGVPPDQDMAAEIDAAARARGLTKLQELWPDFESPIAMPQYQYYVDRKNKILAGVPAGTGVTIGDIPVTRTLYSLQGDEPDQKYLPVYARAPGAYE